MAVKYKLVQRKDMSKGAEPDAKRYYAQSYSSGMCTIKELCDTIADRSTATAGDVKLVIDGLVHVMAQRLAAGQTVQLAELGYFQAILGSKGVVDKKDFTSDMIKTRKIRFIPGVILSDVRKKLKTTRTDTVTEETEEEEGGGGF